MAGAKRAPSVDDMPRIIIAGGGIAGLEALIALRVHLGPNAEIELLEANTDLVERQRAVAEPFGGEPARHFDLVRIAADHGARLRPDRLSSVDADQRRVRTVRGDTLDYDALLVAVGATADVAVPGALTFCGPHNVAAFTALLDDLDAGRVERVAFAPPTSVSWALPLYELALMTGEHVRAKELADVGLILVDRRNRRAYEGRIPAADVPIPADGSAPGHRLDHRPFPARERRARSPAPRRPKSTRTAAESRHARMKSAWRLAS